MVPPRRRGLDPWPRHQHQHQNHHRFPRPHHHPGPRAPRPGQTWKREPSVNFEPRPPPWRRSGGGNGDPNEPGFHLGPTSQYDGFHPKHGRIPNRPIINQRKGNYRPPPLLPDPQLSPLLDSPDPGPSSGPIDKQLCDTIETVKRKLKERKTSETRESDHAENSPCDESLPPKSREKKRTEHARFSVKIPSNCKKTEKTDDKLKCPVSPSSPNIKSRVLRRRILQQLFKLNNVEIRKLVSHPEYSVKYNSAISSLFKETRDKLSRELRSVAEKSLEFHNIPANTEQGEKIVQDAFLGHLGTMLDNNSSIELFSMDPQVINELGKVLREDLMGPIDGDISEKNLVDVMHETISDASPFRGMKNPQGYMEESEFKQDTFNFDYHASHHESKFSNENPMPSLSNSSDFEKRLQTFQTYANNFQFTGFPKMQCAFEPVKGNSEAADNKNMRDEILRNFDIATNKYGKTLNSDSLKKTKRVRSNSSKEADNKDSNDRPVDNNNLIENGFNLIENTSNFEPVKIETIVSDNFAYPPPQNYVFDTSSDIPFVENHFPTMNSMNVTDFTHFHDAYASSMSQQNAPPQIPYRVPDNVANQHTPFNKNCENKNKSYDEIDSKKSTHFAAQNEKRKRIKFNKLQPKNRSKSSSSNPSRDIDCKSAYISDVPYSSFNENSNRKLNNWPIESQHAGHSFSSSIEPVIETMEPSKNSDQKAESVSKTDNLSSDPISIVDVSKLMESKESPNTRDKLELVKKRFKSQGTQYYDFRKVNSSTQVYASLITSKSKGLQTSKINCKDIFCQTLKWVCSNETEVVTDVVEKECQTDPSVDTVSEDVKKSKVAMINKEIQVSIVNNSYSNINSLTKQSDVIKKMKQIDSEIQSLIQTKFKLYKLLENDLTNDEDKFNFNFGFISENKPQVKVQNRKPIARLKACSESIDEKYNINDTLNKRKGVQNITRSRIIRNPTVENKESPNKVKRTLSKSTSDNTIIPLNKVRKRERISTLKKDMVTSPQKNLNQLQSSPCSNTLKNVELSCDNIVSSCNINDFTKVQNLPFTHVVSEEIVIGDESYSCSDQQNVHIDSNVNCTKKIQDKIACKRKNRSGLRSKRKVTPLSTLMAQLDESESDTDDDSTNAISAAKVVEDISEDTSDIITNQNVKISTLKKKFNLKNCFVSLETMNISSDSNNEIRVQTPNSITSNTHAYNNDISILDDINSVEFESLTDPDIPNMLENIGGSETMTLMENWDAKLFDNMTLSESVDVFDNPLTVEKDPLNIEDNSLNTDTNVNSNELIDKDTQSDISNGEEVNNEENIFLTDHSDSIISIECIGNRILAASLDGNVYNYCLNRGILLKKIECSNNGAITSLWIKNNVVYTGSLDSNIKCFNFDEGIQLFDGVNVGSPIQSMCLAWDTMYIGTRTGFVVQFDIITNTLVPNGVAQFSDSAVLALNAIKEGARKVLLIASRSQNVTVKDANTGLLLRTFHGPNTTVYSLLFTSGKVFCGTSGSDIQVFDFVTGNLIGLHNGGNGAVCLKFYRGLLFTGCYDGFIYVFKLGSEEPIIRIPGPGKMLLAMMIVDDKIIAGCNDKTLSIFSIPNSIINEMTKL